MSDPAVIYGLTGALLAAAGIALLVAALFADRSRGRRRCPKCWYGMDAVPGLVCPECGRDARRVRNMFRTRRRWKTAAASVLILGAAAPILLVPRVQRLGSISLVPTTLLVLLLPYENGTSIDYTTLTSAPRLQLAAARELMRRGGTEAIPRFMWPRVVVNTGMIDSPESWIEGVPVPVRVNAVGWAPDLQLTARVGRTSQMCCVVGPTRGDGSCFSEAGDSRGSLRADPLPCGLHTMTFTIQLGDPGVVWEGVVTTPITIVPTSEWQLEPVTDALTSDAIASSTLLVLSHPANSDGMVPFSVVSSPLSWPDPDEIWVELGAELLIGEHAIPIVLSSREGRNPFSFPALSGIAEVPEQLGEVKIRLHGVPPTTPEGVRTRRYWAGSIDFRQATPGQIGQEELGFLPLRE